MYLSSLSLVCCFRHVSFPGALSEWRIVVFPQREHTLGKLTDVVLPCVIKVTSSVDFQVGIFLCHVITLLVKNTLFFSKNSFHVIFIFKNLKIHPDEVEDDSEVMLIQDFNVDKINLSLTVSQSLVKPQTSTSAERLPIMPLLNLNKVVCNCGSVSRHRKLILESCAAASAATDLQKLSIAEVPVDTDGDAVEDKSPEEDEEDNEEFDCDHEAVEFTSCDKTDGDLTESLFTESFKIERQFLPQAFSTKLKKLQRKLMIKISVRLKLHFRPINRRDENVIIVLAYPVVFAGTHRIHTRNQAGKSNRSYEE